MTTPIEETYVVVDADLDTADDDRRHFTHACPGAFNGEGPAIAWCGEAFIAEGLVGKRIDRYTCQECIQIFRSPGALCPRGCNG